MKPETSGKIGRGLVMGICFTAYIFLLYSVLSNGLGMSLHTLG